MAIPNEVMTTAPVREFSSVTEEEWASLATKRFFFGHQSVGENILQGVEEVLTKNPHIRLRIIESSSADSITGPGLFHSEIGFNGDPASKLKAFGAMATRDPASIAMMKFCYLDIDGTLSAEALFADYQRAIAELRIQRPDLVVIHATLPLTDIGNWKERVVKTLRRRPTTRRLNTIRNEYNALVRSEYAGAEPILDIARIESTRNDGSRSFFTRGDETIYHLAPELTDEGGHLNAGGRTAAAENLLALLASL